MGGRREVRKRAIDGTRCASSAHRCGECAWLPSARIGRMHAVPGSRVIASPPPRDGRRRHPRAAASPSVTSRDYCPRTRAQVAADLSASLSRPTCRPSRTRTIAMSAAVCPELQRRNGPARSMWLSLGESSVVSAAWVGTVLGPRPSSCVPLRSSAPCALPPTSAWGSRSSTACTRP